MKRVLVAVLATLMVAGGLTGCDSDAAGRPEISRSQQALPPDTSLENPDLPCTEGTERENAGDSQGGVTFYVPENDQHYVIVPDKTARVRGDFGFSGNKECVAVFEADKLMYTAAPESPDEYLRNSVIAVLIHGRLKSVVGREVKKRNKSHLAAIKKWYGRQVTIVRPGEWSGPTAEPRTSPAPTNTTRSARPRTAVTVRPPANTYNPPVQRPRVCVRRNKYGGCISWR